MATSSSSSLSETMTESHVDGNSTSDYTLELEKQTRTDITIEAQLAKLNDALDQEWEERLEVEMKIIQFVKDSLKLTCEKGGEATHGRKEAQRLLFECDETLDEMMKRLENYKKEIVNTSARLENLKKFYPEYFTQKNLIKLVEPEASDQEGLIPIPSLGQKVLNSEPANVEVETVTVISTKSPMKHLLADGQAMKLAKKSRQAFSSELQIITIHSENGDSDTDDTPPIPQLVITSDSDWDSDDIGEMSEGENSNLEQQYSL